MNRPFKQLPVVAGALFVAATAVAAAPANPFAEPSPLPFQAPQFDRIHGRDYQPAFDEGMQQELAEANAIAASPGPPTFENTIIAMEKMGRMLDRVSRTFNAVVQANTNPTLDQVQTLEAPLSSPGTGSATPNRCAKSNTTSTKTR